MQALFSQEDIPVEYAAWRCRKFLAGRLPDEVKAYIAQHEWINNFFMRDARSTVWCLMAVTPVSKSADKVWLFY